MKTEHRNLLETRLRRAVFIVLWLTFAVAGAFATPIGAFTAELRELSITPIPEPATLALIGGGLIALGLLCRRFPRSGR